MHRGGAHALHRHHMFFERSRDDACVCRLQLREKREGMNKSIAADEEEKGTRAPPLQLRCFYSSDGALTVCCRHRAPAAKIRRSPHSDRKRLARINDNLARKVSSRTEYDKTITEVRSALPTASRGHPSPAAARGCCFCCYMRVCCRRRPLLKIMESSQTLLHVLKRESVNLTKKKQASDGV